MEVTVSYSRKVSVEPYGAREAFAAAKATEIELAELDVDQLAALTLTLSNSAVIQVCEQLGLGYQAGEDGRVRESEPAAGAVVLAFPGAVAQPAPVAAVAAPAPPPPSPLAPVPAASLVQPPNIPLTGDAERDQLIADINANPQNWIDVRAQKKNPKGPDFRHRTIPDVKNPQYKLSAWITAR